MWLVLALGASLFWGLTYVLDEQLYKHVSVLTILALHSTLSALVGISVAFSVGYLRTDIATLFSNQRLTSLFIISSCAAVCAGLLIGFSIATRNATLAGLIEISYPLFIVLFSYLLFREHDLSLGAVGGGFLILCGVALIYWSSQ